MYQFDLAYDLKSVTQQYAGVPIESDEVLINSRTTTFLAKDYTVNDKNWVGQYFQPSMVMFPVGDASWRLTRVSFQAKQDGATDGQIRVQIRTPAADHTPTTTVLEEKTLNESALSTAYSWQNIAFDNVAGLAPSAGLCLVLQYGAGGGNMAKVYYENFGGSDRLPTSNGDAGWTCDSNRSLYYCAYGKVVTPGPVQTATRQYVTAVRLALQSGTDSAARVDGAARTLNAPEVLAAVWELDFDRNPTTLDVNGDGMADWVRADHQPFNPATLSGGVWLADAALNTQPNADFSTLTTVDVRFRNTSMGGSGAMVSINADWTGGTCAPLLGDLRLQADNTQTLTVYGKSDSATLVRLLTVPGLSNGFVTLRLLIDPSLNTVNAHVNDVDQGTRVVLHVRAAEQRPLCHAPNRGEHVRVRLRPRPGRRKLMPSLAHDRRAIRGRKCSGAFTLIEIIVAMAVMSVMLVAALNTVAAARTGQYKAEERNRAVLLAQRLMGEILQQAYTDPVAGLGSFGPDAGETTVNRSLFDDVDDYHNWLASPPQNKDGSAIPWATGYEELVSVAWVSSANLSQTSGSETGVKRIIVTIKHFGREVLTLTAYRTSAWVDPVSLQ